MSNIIHANLSYKVMSLAFTVHNILGPGLLESCYENAMAVELQRSGIYFKRQQIFTVHYKGEIIGEYIADLVVANTIILELKSVQVLNPVMESQLLNYLRISRCPIGYLLNFNAPKLIYKRLVY